MDRQTERELGGGGREKTEREGGRDTDSRD